MLEYVGPLIRPRLPPGLQIESDGDRITAANDKRLAGSTSVDAEAVVLDAILRQ